MADASHPKDWNKFLDHFADLLSGVEQALAKAAGWESAGGKRADAHAACLQEQAKAQDGLDGKAAEIGHWVDAIESELRVSEDLLRVLLTQTEAVRQKLATWAQRAIR